MELAAALRRLKPGKSPGLNYIIPEFILQAGLAMKSCFCDFLTPCMRQLKTPKIWRRALVVPIHKPEKPLGDPKTYRPMSLLCVPFKMLEKLIYARVDPVIDPLLPREQVDFRHGSSTLDQVTLLTQDIEDSFSLKRRTELCLSTSQQPTTLYCTAASPASCCNCCLIDTWST